jgi:lipopolysaccharide biosynthesis glycosyltransferase
MINIAFAIHNKNEYCRHLAVAIISVLNNTKEKIIIHLLHDDTLLIKDKQILLELVEKYGQTIVFYNIDFKYKNQENSTFQENTVGTLFRFQLPGLLQNIEKVIYFDCDILCDIDIKELWNIDLKDNMIAAVQESEKFLKRAHRYKVYQNLKIINENYFNAGVLVINLKFIKNKERFFENCMHCLKEYPNLPYLDQDVFNKLFQKKCLHIPKKYNMMIDNMEKDEKVRYLFSEEKANVCWHFAGKEKPWIFKTYPVFKLYWKYFMMTPWGNTSNKTFFYLYELHDGSLDKIMLTQTINSRKDFVVKFFMRLFNEFVRFIHNKN